MRIALFYEFLGTAIVTYAFNLGLQNGQVRATAYFIAYILAASISGAHFNPATSLAVFLYEKQYANWIFLLIEMLVQLCGSFLGIFVSYLLVKDYERFALFPETGNSVY